MTDTSKDKAFVEISFSDEVKDYFHNYINQIIPSTSLYYSPVAEHIRGNMASTLHCTLYFGLTVEEMKNSRIINLLTNANIKELKLGDLHFLEGYQNLYKVLILDIVDTDDILLNLAKEISKHAEDKRFIEREFKPHLTLAYTDLDYTLPKQLSKLNKLIPIDQIRMSLVSEFNKSVNKKDLYM